MKSIQAKLTSGILIIAFLGFSIAGGFCYWISRKALIESNIQKSIYASAYQAEVFDRWLDSQKFLAGTYAEVVMRYDNSDEILDVCIALDKANKDFLAVYAAFSDGGGIFSDGWIPGDDWDATQREWYIKAMENKDEVILVTPYYDPSTYETVVTISKYAGRFENKEMVFAIDIEISDLLNIMTTIEIAENGYVFLADEDGTIVTHDNPDFRPVGNDAHHMQDYEQYQLVYNAGLNSNPMRVTDYDGDNRYFVPSYLASAGWVLYLAVPEASLYQNIDMQMKWVMLIYFVILIILFLSLKILTDRIILKRITKLVVASEKVAGGELNVVFAENSKDEIGILSRRFGKVADSMNSVLGDLDQMSAYHGNGDYEFRMDESKYSGAYLNVVSKMNSMADLYSENLQDILEVLQQFGLGNFNADIKQYPGKLGICNEVVLSLKTNLKNVVVELDAIAAAVLEGQLSTRADIGNFQGDWSGIMRRLNNVLEAIAIPIQEASKVLLEISEGRLGSRMSGNYKGDFAEIKDMMDKTSYTLSSYIKEISSVLEQLANNNYDQNVTVEFAGDFVQIKDSINKIILKLNQVLNSIINATGQVSAGSRQVLLSSEKLAQDAINQAEVVSELNAHANLIKEQALNNAQNSQTVNTITVNSKNNAITSRKEMNRMIDSIKAVQIAADNISSIMKAINDIAFQTNLLALNAAVEAARAGSHGKGFAVVAEEIRQLSTRSTDAAKETEALIENTIKAVLDSNKIVQATSKSFDILIDDIESVSEYVAEISHASEEQANNVGEIVKSINQLSIVAENTRSISQESAATAQQLSANANSFSNSLNVFQFKKAQDAETAPRQE